MSTVSPERRLDLLRLAKTLIRDQAFGTWRPSPSSPVQRCSLSALAEVRRAIEARDTDPASSINDLGAVIERLQLLTRSRVTARGRGMARQLESLARDLTSLLQGGVRVVPRQAIRTAEEALCLVAWLQRIWPREQPKKSMSPVDRHREPMEREGPPVERKGRRGSDETTAKAPTPLDGVVPRTYAHPRSQKSQVRHRREPVTIVEVGRGKWLVRTTDGAVVPCRGVPGYRQPQPGLTCRALVTRVDGKATEAVFKGW